jgi:hypothetical protein
MSGPFILKKKERRRRRKRAQLESDWASEHALSGDKPEGAISGLNFLSQHNMEMACLRKKARSKNQKKSEADKPETQPTLARYVADAPTEKVTVGRLNNDE